MNVVTYVNVLTYYKKINLLGVVIRMVSIPLESITETKIVSEDCITDTRSLNPDMVYEDYSTKVGSKVRIYISKTLSGKPGFEVNGTIVGAYRSEKLLFVVVADEENVYLIPWNEVKTYQIEDK